jgi:amino acid permease
MLRTRSSFTRSFLLLVGTIIGAGVFGVPLVFSRMGVITGSVVFWIVALLVMCSHLLFVELIARDPNRRRLPGYVGKILGRWSERAAVVSHSMHLIGANLAYLILGGEFLAALLSPVLPNLDVLSWQTVFWLGGVVTVLAGLAVMSRVESAMTWVEASSMAVIALLSFAYIRGPIIATADWSQATVGLGIFLFALSGLTVMPEVYELAARKVTLTRRVTIAASLLTAVLTWLFGIGVYLAAGERELGSAAAIAAILPTTLAWLLPLFGFFAVATSYLTTAFDLRSMYIYDMKWGTIAASVFALGAPLALLLFSSRDFFDTMDVVGAFFSASNALLVAVAAGIIMQRGAHRPPFWWRTLIPVAATALFLFVIVQRFVSLGVH